MMAEILTSGVTGESMRRVLHDDFRALELARRMRSVALHGDLPTILRELP